MKQRTIRQDLSTVVIVKVKIEPKSRFDFDPMNKVTVWYSNRTKEVLHTYCPDEMTFTEAELLGKTAKDAHAMRDRKERDFIKKKNREHNSPYASKEEDEEDEEDFILPSQADEYYRFHG